MAEEWSKDRALETLNTLLSGAPDASTFMKAVKLVDESEGLAPGFYDEHAGAILSAALGSWPAHTRTVEFYELDELAARAAKPWASWIGGVTLFGIEPSDGAHVEWVTAELRSALPAIQHIEFYGLSAKKKDIERACSSGLFDGVTSLAFADVAFKPATLDLVLSRLEDTGGLERLGFRRSITQSVIGRLFSSPLAASLKHLGLRDNPGLKAKGIGELARHAHVFSSLEVLDLSSNRLSSTSAKDLASASWASTFSHIDLRATQLGTKGVKAILDAGAFVLLTPPDAPGRLDMTTFAIKDKGLEALSSRPELAAIDELVLFQNQLTSLASLRDAPHLGRLEHLDLGKNEFTPDQEDVALELVEKTRPASLSFDGANFSDAFVEALCALDAADGFERLILGRDSGRYGEGALRAILGLIERVAPRHLEFIAEIGIDSDLVSGLIGDDGFSLSRPASDPNRVRVVSSARLRR